MLNILRHFYDGDRQPCRGGSYREWTRHVSAHEESPSNDQVGEPKKDGLARLRLSFLVEQDAVHQKEGVDGHSVLASQKVCCTAPAKYALELASVRYRFPSPS